MKPKPILIATSVALLLLVALGWWLVAAKSPEPEVRLQSSVVPSGVGQPVVAKPETTTEGKPAAVAVTAGDLLADQSLSERELVAGLTRIVAASSRKAEDRDEALSHLLNLTVEDGEPVLMELARDRSLSPALADRLFTDAFNRPLSWQVDLGLVLLERKDMETMHAAVREHVVFLVGPDVAADSDLTTLKRAGEAAKKNWAAQAAQ